MANFSPADFNLTKAAYSIKEVTQLLPLKPTALYAAIRGGKLRATKCGRRTVLLRPDIINFLSSLPMLQNYPKVVTPVAKKNTESQLGEVRPIKRRA